MTTTRKKSSASKKRTSSNPSSGKKAASRRKKTSKADRSASRGLSLEILILTVMAVCVLLFISNLGIGGIVGNAVSTFFFGLFGVIAYLFPFVLFFGMTFWIANASNPLVERKLWGAAGTYVFFCGFMQLLMVGYDKNATLSELYKLCAQDKTGGGILGAVLVKILGFAFGIAGAYVILVAGLIISVIVMTQRPILRQLQNQGSKVYKSARSAQEDLRRKREEAKEQQSEKQHTSSYFDGELIVGSAEEPAEKNSRRKKDKEKTVPTQEMPAAVAPFPEFQPEFSIVRSEPEPDLPEDIREEALSGSKKAKSDEKKPERTAAKNPKSSSEEIAQGIENIQQEISSQEPKEPPVYHFPPITLLKKGDGKASGDSEKHVRETAMKLQQTLHSFGVNATLTNVSCGPTVTRYELQPEQGVKVSKIVNLTDDIKLNLAAADVRIEAPIPGKAAVGIEVPNATNSPVMLRDLLESPAFTNHPSALAFAAGKDIAGQPVVTDIAKMPHLLIAGATGSGKSVCINTLIMSILYKARPEDVKLIMIDPKVVELSVYNGIPHLYIPVVTDPKKAAGALNWAVAEMTDRYNKFAQYNVRDLKGYNAKVEQIQDIDDPSKPQKMPQIVIIVDELADLMMVAPGEVEDAICRLAQLARAAGIHLIIATQRPSVNVITGLIKANMPSRIAFSVSSGVDSRTILDMNGAEKLLGKGDMLFYPQGYQKPARLQGAFVSDREVSDVVEFLSQNAGENVYDSDVEQKINSGSAAITPGASGGNDLDAYFVEAGKFIIEKDKASIGMLQRMFKIGFNRAARIMDQLCEAGVVGEEEGTKPRKVLMSQEQFENYIEQSL